MLPEHVNKLKSPDQYFELFLIGDTGSIARTGNDQVLETMKAHFDPEIKSAVVFLGDNVYPRGLPDKKNILRADAEKALNQHWEAMKNYHGKVLFISGNHDWNKGRKDGYEYVLRQEKYLEKLFGDRNVFLPTGGCPGPVKIDLGENLVLILINTQWWLQSGFRPIGSNCGCSVDTEDDFFNSLESILKNNSGKRIVIAGHAPVYSYAIHGGRYKLKHHLFPFTLYKRGAYVPLPVIGSLIPLYRKYFGAREDIAHPRYRKLRHRLKELLAKYNGLIYAAGHEHNLQHIKKDGNHFIISGAGSKLKYVLEEGKNLLFGAKKKGFFKLGFNADGDLHVSAWAIDSEIPRGKLIYETIIKGRL
ncbi:metallophosphoesterase [Pedobacter sp. HMF7647]|uniref:Metallophosphoesterase n=1 Tax=Hufsiella arboris TaxID=2695275 RepID=A0A7K1YDS9_9SPHI|nr:metallophosphoesterase [Hufsiella arboris]